jgi:hypothetical protein
MAVAQRSSSLAYHRLRLPTPTERDRLADYLRLGGWEVEARLDRQCSAVRIASNGSIALASLVIPDRIDAVGHRRVFEATGQ